MKLLGVRTAMLLEEQQYSEHSNAQELSARSFEARIQRFKATRELDLDNLLRNALIAGYY